ncbi:histidine phosphatase family protein [Phycicoccus endophyticus]|uniref:Histidine phosphatase family protein n=1 Tax=Phycicoccus endophyticus TaxID=1690220 RepID=A0A7G9QZJ4_9MICO|nr:histidine phosphatase family protein [Phycicoccus endophyticus]NHI19135.1 histidine phosphatase family protein [Phycicoccus endophyticus]QNN48769.1 histidine phosphatase family protein [Phycicoccus endophyticus]GGL33020.1 histidine phosphatase family protein [Phycicoccus endophyticus]
MTSSPGGAAPTEPRRTTVHLLRHGEVHNPGHVLYGRLPGYHLSELGRRMADLAAEHLADHDVVHVVSSPLERAQETAAPVAAAHGLETTLDERLIEAENAFEGLPVAGGRGLLRHPRLWPRMLNPLRPSWGEPYPAVVERMRDAVLDARAAAYGHEAVLVSHQAPIWMIRLATEGRSLVHNPGRRECSLASLTSLTFLGEELLSLAYCEPAAALLPLAHKGAGA